MSPNVVGPDDCNCIQILPKNRKRNIDLGGKDNIDTNIDMNSMKKEKSQTIIIHEGRTKILNKMIYKSNAMGNELL